MASCGTDGRGLSRDGLLGEAIGDAFGVPVEFLRKKDTLIVTAERFEKILKEG